MSKRHKRAMLPHAAKMLWRNKTSYLMLSVTIVLSFSLLLGYLTFTDSRLYNRYKELFSAREDVVMAYSYDKSPVHHAALATSAKKADASVTLYQYFSMTTKLPQAQGVYVDLYFLPAGNRPVYEMVLGNSQDFLDIFQYARQINPIKGKTDFALKDNEAIINESLFRAISPDGSLPVTLGLPVTWADGKTEYWALNVVGVCADLRTSNTLSYDEKGNLRGEACVYLSQDNLGEHTAADCPVVQRITWMATSHPLELSEYAQRMGMVTYCAMEAQQQALQTIRIEKATKGVIAAVLLLLLGINLYSSFSNALEHRKYEIGVKRAIGASGWSIMKQFLLESIMIMLINILISVLMVTNGMILYKLYQSIFRETEWIVSISEYSVIMFLICSVVLTVLFSSLFAYKSTKVEIVQYLKAE